MKTDFRYIALRFTIVFLMIFFSFHGTCALRSENDIDISQLSEKYLPVFQEVNDWLEKKPDLKPGDLEREKMLKKLDEPLSEPQANEMPAVGWFFRERTRAFVEDFEGTDVKEGVAIWKLYNHGVAIRTPELTIAIDLIKGFDEVQWDEEMLDKAINGMDILLITHEHADHADRRIVEKFVEAGKKVIAPNSLFLWEHEDIGKSITRLRGDSITINGVKITAFAGYQILTPNNIYLIETPEGIRIMHLGDDNETVKMGSEWFRKFNPPMEIDVLIPNSWCPNLAFLMQFVKPKIIISSHEHEISHRTEGRRSYDYVYKVLSTLNVPFTVPAWGEKFVFE